MTLDSHSFTAPIKENLQFFLKIYTLYFLDERHLTSLLVIYQIGKQCLLFFLSSRVGRKHYQKKSCSNIFHTVPATCTLQSLLRLNFLYYKSKKYLERTRRKSNMLSGGGKELLYNMKSPSYGPCIFMALRQQYATTRISGPVRTFQK